MIDASPRCASQRGRWRPRRRWRSPRVAVAAGEDDLVSLINARRAETRGCGGAREAAAGPLAPSASLARVDASATAGDLGQALIAAGYRAATATTIVLSGVADARSAARLIEERHCDAVRNRRYAEIGVARAGSTLAPQPRGVRLLAGDLGDWREAGSAVLRLVNDARRRGGICGAQRFAAAPALPGTTSSVRRPSRTASDMAVHDYFDHADRRGAVVAERARRHGYPWRVIGENIAAGQGSAQQVVAGWLASPGHCANILSPEFKEMATAYALNPQASMEIYWTQVFGSR